MQREAAREHGQPAEHVLLGRFQQRVAPVQRRAQGALVRLRGARGVGQQVQADTGCFFVGKVLGQTVYAQHRHPRRRQFKGEWQAVQRAAHPQNGQPLLAARCKARQAHGHALHEQLHGATFYLPVAELIA